MKKAKQIIKITIISILILFSGKLNAQNWILGGNPQFGLNGTSSFVGANFYGTLPLNPDNLIFGTGGATQMTLLTNGHFGIGLSPGPDILDIAPPIVYTGYGINGFTVLHNTGVRNLALGVGAGTLYTGIDNTFVGFGSGNSLAAGNENVYVGSQTGSTIGNRIWCTFVGALAGQSYTTGQDNTFIGARAGRGTVNGGMNTFVGTLCGVGNVAGAGNAFLGDEAGSLNINGNNNVFLGFLAGTDGGGINGNTNGSGNVFAGFTAGFNNLTGNDNIIIGDNANIGTAVITNLNNAISIGANSTVMNTNQMILGDNTINVGIGLSGLSAGPARSLEINAVISPNPSIDITPGASGLRFRDLTSGSSNGIASYGKVLTVNGSGDVVLTDDIGGNGSVTPCAGSAFADIDYITKWTNVLPGSSVYEICRTAGIYESPAGANFVGIGVGTSPQAKLHVNGDILMEYSDAIQAKDGAGTIHPILKMYPGYATISVGANAGSLSTGLWDVYAGYKAGSSTIGANYCTFVGSQSGLAYVSGVSNENNTFIGADAAIQQVDGTDNTYVGGRSVAPDMIHGSNNTYVGTLAGRLVQNGDHNTYIGDLAGALFDGDENVMLGDNAHAITGPTAKFRMALGANSSVGCDYCVSIGNRNQQVGIGWDTPNFIPPMPFPVPFPPPILSLAKLYVSNFGGPTSAFFAGDIIATAAYVPSDSILKTNVQPVTNVNNILAQLNVKSYDYNTLSYPSLNLPQGTQIGLIAEDVQSILPSAVTYASAPPVLDSLGNQIVAPITFRAINYTAFVPLLIASNQEMQQQIDTLRQQLNSCCNLRISNPNTGSNDFPIKQTIDLSSSGPILFQNQPNPFTGETVIRYFIPETAISPKIIFEDETGRVINETIITEKGQNSIKINSESLNAGVYAYSLQINGKVVDSKRMLRTK